MRLTRIVVAAVVTFGALFALARASAAPLAYNDHNMARLRLSWSARPERIEVCRALTAEEIARLGEHMRQRVECTGNFASYDLRVELDGRILDEAIVRGSGFRHDRPLYVLRDFTIASGRHRVRISFTRREQAAGDSVAPEIDATLGADTGLFAGRADRERVERQRRARAAVPAWLALDTAIVMQPGHVVVVSFDVDQKALRIISSDPPSR
jgi:hypothetical protein